ncbi:MAG: TolC family protein [Bacteroidaceae bacterium]|nr:TolC family protein [Bacteroidaceae bacterium]
MRCFIIILIIFLSSDIQAQKVWTMDDCIDFALQHALSIRQQNLQVAAARDQVTQSKLAFTPYLSAGTSGSLSWGRSIDPETNIYNTVNYLNTGFSLSASMTLWDGGRSIIALREAKLNKQRQLNELQRQRINVELQVIQAFINALYFQESRLIHQKKLTDSRALLHQVQVQTELGLKGKADIAQAESQVAEDELSCLQCENQYKQAMLDLKKMMGSQELEVNEELRMNTDENDNYADADTLHHSSSGWLLSPHRGAGGVSLSPHRGAGVVSLSPHRGAGEVSQHPTAVAARMRVKSAELTVKQARASFIPSLSLSAGVSTGYHRSYGTGIAPTPFGKQWHDNMGSSISTGISIPLWDQLSHVNTLRRSKRELTLARWEQEETMRQLQIDFTKACLDVEACQKEIAQQRQKLVADSIAHRVLLRQYEEGLSSFLHLQSAVRTLQQSRISLLRQRLLLILKKRTLKQYGYTS